MVAAGLLACIGAQNISAKLFQCSGYEIHSAS